MKKNVLTLWVMLCCMVINASVTQQSFSFTVKGTLTDSLTLEPEPYATIKISKKESEQDPVKLAVTDTRGNFTETISGTGDFILTITSIGKTTVRKEFTATGKEKIIDLATLYTREATNELAGVEVVALKPLVKVDIDKIEYNVEDDPDSKTSTVLEMLRKVPLVTVDGDDKIQVNGSSSFKVHVNGRPNTLMSDNPSEILKSIPANTIKHIEVVTNPGARYDAEGVGGVLNIVTIGTGFEGYTATISLQARNTGTGASGYITTKKEKFTITGNYNIQHHDQPKGTYRVYQEDLTSDLYRYLYQNGFDKNKGTNHNGSIEASYEIDTLRLFTLSMGVYGGSNPYKGGSTTEMFDVNHNPVYSYNFHSRSHFNFYSLNGSIDYQRAFRTKGRLFTLSYKLNGRPTKNSSETEYTDPDHIPNYLTLLNYTNSGKIRTMEHTLQADYITPFCKYHTLETGVKYIMRNNISDNTYHQQTEKNSDYVYNENRSIYYKHLNDILAVYAGYTFQHKGFTVKPGFRYEHTIQNVKYIRGDGADFTLNHNNLVPTIVIGKKIGKTQNIRAGYNMRIHRPNIYQLNPYRNEKNGQSVSYGNPNLDPEKTHGFNLDYSRFSAMFNVNLSLRHSFSNNSIQSYVKQEKGITESTYANIGKAQMSRAILYVNCNASPNTRITMNSTLSYLHLESKSESLVQKNHGWGFSMYGNIQHTFPYKIRASLHGGGSTRNLTLQGERAGFYYYGMNINRSFVKDRLTLSLFGNNLFKKYRNYTNIVDLGDMKQTTTIRNSPQQFGFSISYRMGDLKASVKKVARTIKNDDLKENEN